MRRSIALKMAVLIGCVGLGVLGWQLWRAEAEWDVPNRDGQWLEDPTPRKGEVIVWTVSEPPEIKRFEVKRPGRDEIIATPTVLFLPPPEPSTFSRLNPLNWFRGKPKQVEITFQNDQEVPRWDLAQTYTFEAARMMPSQSNSYDLLLTITATDGTVILDQTSCPLHATPLHFEKVPIVYGLPFEEEFAYREVIRANFPHTRSALFGGCVVRKDSPSHQVVPICDQCVAAEVAYKAGQAEK